LGEEKKKRENWPGGFFPRPEAGHTLLAVPDGIFIALSRNERLI
jgi:hypothetical protein